MTRQVTISYSALPGTAAGVARTGGALVIADRPAGVAGGDWAVIERIIAEELAARGVPVTVYDLPEAISQQEEPQ